MSSIPNEDKTLTVPRREGVAVEEGPSLHFRCFPVTW